MPSERDVEKLAKWLHETYLQSPIGKKHGVSWRKTGSKPQLRFVARRMLTPPPAVLVKALKERKVRK